MTKFKSIFLASLLMFIACSSIKYQDDLGFLVSAQANSPEFPVYLNGKSCKDLDGNPGMCSKRIATTDTVSLHFDPQDFSYDLTMACTSPMTVPGASVSANQPFDLQITPTQFAGMKSFICIGEIFPQDRTSPISAKFEIRVAIVDVNYVAREGITFETRDGKNYLVLGQYARDSWVFDGSSWKNYSKTTEVEVKDTSIVKAYSSSFSMRYNFLNIDSPVVQ